MKHSSPQFAAIAERSTILRVQVGSGVHGTAIQGQDDRDEMGICVEPPEYVVGLERFDDLGRELRAKPEIVLSRQAGMRFIGYLRSQRAGMLGHRKHTNRPELIEKYGFDAKYAMHMVRLGVQGVELLETGRITLPIPEPWLAWLRDLRQGKHTKDEALAAADELEAELEKLITTSPLPERPDRDLANAWLRQAYQRVWSSPITR
ncbi:hypothetical protein ALI144C_13060 [Actinosynnema sp. ALI-1.44]|uniref:DNA polymerase beta superfamily protein n=1 Tax=Actinosynnema sp. ALI-1.44 TaxID=1933779 RepID=UPI00097BBFBD|nr:nucleotidyltransferase domain-containing protein [Actinosynnema sp. ALI-1.44]ONI85239.1 hypothetical protein ALI144C_13060 [Actinosynnema sp. ALI-1.44]